MLNFGLEPIVVGPIAPIQPEHRPLAVGRDRRCLLGLGIVGAVCCWDRSLGCILGCILGHILGRCLGCVNIALALVEIGLLGSQGDRPVIIRQSLPPLLQPCLSLSPQNPSNHRIGALLQPAIAVLHRPPVVPQLQAQPCPLFINLTAKGASGAALLQKSLKIPKRFLGPAQSA